MPADYKAFLSEKNMGLELTDKEKAVLAIVQDDLPDSPEPYAKIAAQCGLCEEEVLRLLENLKATGAIRRFGASLRHHKTDWRFNAMTAWIASREEADLYAPKAALIPSISHIYYRPCPAPDWPYTLYTMIHGRSNTECEETVKALLDIWPMRDYAVLRTIKEWKKISMRYF